MNHRPATRLAALALAGLFALAGNADVYGLHRCPHHDGGRAADAATAASSVGDRGGPAPLAAAGARSGGHTGHSPADGPCTCVGLCHAGAAAPLPGATTHHPVLAAEPFRTLRPNSLGVAARTSSYLLPFANAPPLRPRVG